MLITRGGKRSISWHCHPDVYRADRFLICDWDLTFIFLNQRIYLQLSKY